MRDFLAWCQEPSPFALCFGQKRLTALSDVTRLFSPPSSIWCRRRLTSLVCAIAAIAVKANELCVTTKTFFLAANSKCKPFAGPLFQRTVNGEVSCFLVSVVCACFFFIRQTSSNTSSLSLASFINF